MYHYRQLKPVVPNRELTAAARAALRGHWGAGAGIMLLTFFLFIIMPAALWLAKRIGCAFFEGPKLLLVLLLFSVFSTLLWLLNQIAGMTLPLYFLRLFDRGNADFGECFGTALRRFAVSVWAAALIGIIVFLKLLLFIIPGILAAYDYVLTLLCLLDDPELRPGEALRRSRAIMHGHRWQFFCLSWRFFGWFLLSIFTLGIGFFWLIPYVQTSIAAFYRSVMPPKEDALHLELPEVKHRPWSPRTNTVWFILILLAAFLQHAAGAFVEYRQLSAPPGEVRMRSVPLLPEE